MALRRLLSGWLIAMAALARSVAQALERASEDRSAPTPDPVMAALAERYPGAPAHWLAHVAERTSQLAEAGEAPLSLNSDPTAWPVRPDGLAPLPAISAEREPASRDPRRPPQPPRRDTAVPTLAALRDRSSEVWRRSEVEPRRRPRPVFAVVTSAPTSERPVRSTVEPAAPPRRPRSPLTVVGSAPQAVPVAPEPASPVSAAPTPKPPSREAAWSEAPPSHPAKTRSDVQRSTERPPIEHAFTQARPKDGGEGRPEASSDRISTSPAVRRQRSWFFARSARVERSIELLTDPGRPAKIGRADPAETIAIARAPVSRTGFPTSTVDRPIASDKTWPDRTSPPRRGRLFRTLAALAQRRRADRYPEADPTGVPTSPSIDRPSQDTASKESVPSFAPPRTIPAARPAPAFSHVEGGALDRTKADASPRAARRIVREARNPSSLNDEAPVRDRRSSFSARPPAASRGASGGFAVSPSDNRWPALPPPTLEPPRGVEAPTPRWDQLAREQEEGRWSV